MIKIYRGLIRLAELLLNIMFVLQIALMVVIFITATYWFLNLIDSTAFEFARPLADSITDFVRLFYKNDIEVGGIYIDGSLLLFDILAMIFVFLVTKAKYYVYLWIEKLEGLVRGCQKRIEKKFNEELHHEVVEKVQQYNNVAILVQFGIKNLYIDNSDDDIKVKEEEAFKIFYATIKSLSGCKFAKTDNKMLILLDDFSHVDNLLNFIDMTIKRIRVNMRKDKWLLISYSAVEVYCNDVDLKSEVYPVLEKLLSLRSKNEMLCLGNFNLRYKLNPTQIYTFTPKGPYDIFQDCNVFGLIKKN